VQHSKSRTAALAAGMAGILVFAGCATTPVGPTVQVMPGEGKSFAVFTADQDACKQYATQQVAGQAQAANNQAIGTAVLSTALGTGLGAAVGGGYGARVGAASGAATGTAIGAGQTQANQMSIQQQYDNAFAQCMYAKHDQVAGWEPAPPQTYGPPQQLPPPPPPRASDPLVAKIQTELMRLGFLGGPADGVLGPRTRAAISNYEKTQGLPPDGTPSEALLDSLRKS
jgi:uncharacterized protein YcfJ